jgi:hypothetical protein
MVTPLHGRNPHHEQEPVSPVTMRLSTLAQSIRIRRLIESKAVSE